MRNETLHPNTRLSLALVVSLALWWPTLQGAIGGSIDPLAAALRWVAAFAMASLSLRLVLGLVESYAAPADDGEDAERVEQEGHTAGVGANLG